MLTVPPYQRNESAKALYRSDSDWLEKKKIRRISGQAALRRYTGGSKVCAGHTWRLLVGIDEIIHKNLETCPNENHGIEQQKKDEFGSQHISSIARELLRGRSMQAEIVRPINPPWSSDLFEEITDALAEALFKDFQSHRRATVQSPPGLTHVYPLTRLKKLD